MTVPPTKRIQWTRRSRLDFRPYTIGDARTDAQRSALLSARGRTYCESTEKPMKNETDRAGVAAVGCSDG